MTQFIKYPSIDQYRHIVKSIQTRSKYIKNDEGIAEYDPNAQQPVIEFTGTVKLHGTNAAICTKFDSDNFWVQSRKRILTLESDNYGFATYCERRRNDINQILTSISYCCSIAFGPNTKDYTLCVYGEWCGGSIRGGVGISETEKMFVVFGVRLVKMVDDEIINEKWLPINQIKINVFNDMFDNFYVINQFPTYSLKIDFAEPLNSQNELVELTNQVEAECPVARRFGIQNGVGEGIVWTAAWNGGHYVFKVKGEKHSVSKVKKLAEVDPVKLENISKFAEYAVTENRLNQCYTELSVDKPLTIQRTGEFVKWMIGDIAKEEMDVVVESGLEFREVTNKIGKVSVKWFHQKLDAEVGL